MNISNAKYFKDMTDENVVGIKATINGNLSWIPLDANNTDYQAILAWAKEDGNEIQAAE
tara:strand:+ start:338 stop:514 length:177 start_codon:yes stop_codon:yes gene_type:complete